MRSRTHDRATRPRPAARPCGDPTRPTAALLAGSGAGTGTAEELATGDGAHHLRDTRHTLARLAAGILAAHQLIPRDCAWWRGSEASGAVTAARESRETDAQRQSVKDV